MKTILYQYRYALVHECAYLTLLCLAFATLAFPSWIKSYGGEPMGWLNVIGFYFGVLWLFLIAFLWGDEAWYTGMNELLFGSDD